MRSRKFKWMLGILSLLVMAFGIHRLSDVEESKTTEQDSRAGVVERIDLVQKVLLTGQIVPKKSTWIAPPFSGYVHKLNVKVGDAVRAGDPLVSVSQLPLSNGAGVFPIPAPFSGKVVSISKNEGEYVDGSTSLGEGRNGMLRLDDVSAFFVESDVPEIDYIRIKKDLSATVSLTASPQQKYHARIVSLAAAPRQTDNWDRNRVEYPVRIAIDNPDASMTSGMTATVEVITNERKNALALKNQFISRRNDKYFVKDMTGRDLPVQVGLQNEEYFEITSGLAEGDRVKPVDFSVTM